jgi:two-component system, cell cycle response regulator
MIGSGESVSLRRPGAACHVLVVDDDELIRRRMVSLLKLAGYEVQSASSGDEALRILNARPCRIVVTDWEMPGMDGAALCRALRTRDEESYTYVMMLSVRHEPADILAGLGAGADDYLSKSTSSEEFLARLEVGRRITRLEHSLRLTAQENLRLSITDPLTGAQNRSFLMKTLPRELERARRYGRPIAVLSCDIDNFRHINERYGHEAGDDVLREFVARSTGTLREAIDWVARVGGEEFIIVLPETNLAGGSTVAEKLRRAFGGLVIATSSGPLSTTVSIGVTALESAGELATISVAELLRAAERCLYMSKTLGRDRSTSLGPVHAAQLAIASIRGHRETN